jgi:UDP-N-acetylglucosamine 4,6-dehydratase
MLPITDPDMTRFWITLDQAAHFVLKVLELAKGGEIFVPKIPSMKITEKIHETLIGEDEGRNAIEYKDCYVVRQDHLNAEKRLDIDNGGRSCPKGFRYSSDNNPERLGIEELREILEQISDDYSIEKTRWAMDDIPQ